jgi:vitamin B12 transporter
MRATLRALAALCCASSLASTSLLFAQEPETTELVPQDLVQAPATPTPLPPRRPELELPETTVVGAPSGIGSQGGAAPGNTLLTTPNLTPTELSQTGSSVSVITAEQIAQRKQIMVAEVLRGLPGVQVVQNGGPGGTTSVFLRGSASEQTKVLLDGIPINDPTSPGRGFDFSNMTVDNIERIEVIRGPQSTLYGSDAIGGVINIITKKGQGPMSTRVSSQGGAFGTQQYTGNVSGGDEYRYYSIGASYLATDGISAADMRLPGNTEPDGFRLGTLSSRVGWTPTDRFDVDFVLRFNRSTTQIDNGGGPTDNITTFNDDPLAKTLTSQVYTRTAIRHMTIDDFWEQRISYNTVDEDRQTKDAFSFFEPIFGPSPVQHFAGTTQFIDWRHNIFLHETNTVTFGTVYQQENLLGDAPRGLRDTAFYAQDQIKLWDRWFTTLGVRNDAYSVAGPATTYRATSLYRFQRTQTALRGSIGSGFKAPTIFQLFAPTFGNTSLRPERSEGWDIGVEQPMADGKLVVGAAYFQNTYQDLINTPFTGVTFGFANFGPYTNIDRAFAAGTELSAAWNPTPVTTVTLSYTNLDARNLVTGRRLLRRPSDQLNVNWNRKLLNNRANLNFNTLYVSGRADEDFNGPPDPVTGGGTPVTLPSYIVVNVAGSYDVNRNLQVFGRIDNLFDQRYEQVFGFGTMPISFYGGLTLTR